MEIFDIYGDHITDISSFYEEINRVFMQDEDWTLGNSLDAFDDMLYGGFGAIDPKKISTIVWHDAMMSKETLGYEATRLYYEKKLQPDSPFNKALFRQKLEELVTGKGKTYFDILKEIIDEHPNIRLEER